MTGARRRSARVSNDAADGAQKNVTTRKTMSSTSDKPAVRKLYAIDEVANFVPAEEAVYDRDYNIIAEREPEQWVHKETGAEVVPDVVLPCIHAWEGDAENVRRGLAACWALGVPAREVLALWGRCDWRQVSCVSTGNKQRKGLK